MNSSFNEEIQERNRDLDELQALSDEQQSEPKEAIEQAAILRVELHEDETESAHLKDTLSGFDPSDPGLS